MPAWLYVFWMFQVAVLWFFFSLGCYGLWSIILIWDNKALMAVWFGIILAVGVASYELHSSMWTFCISILGETAKCQKEASFIGMVTHLTIVEKICQFLFFPYNVSVRLRMSSVMVWGFLCKIYNFWGNVTTYLGWTAVQFTLHNLPSTSQFF